MKKKIIILVSILIIIALITVSVVFVKNNKKEENTEEYLLIKDNLIFEINSEIKNIDLLQNEENDQLGYKVINEEENIDTSKLGENEYIFKYTNNKGDEKEQNVGYEIIDTTAPIITSEESIELTIGDELKISEIATVTDNSKEELEIKIEGEYDINTKGEYKVKLISEDSSRNKAEKDFTIIIKEKPVEVVENNTNNNHGTSSNNSNSNSSKPSTSQNVPSNPQNNPSSNNKNNSNNQTSSSLEEYDPDYLMKKGDQLGAEGRAYAAEIKQKVWTYVPNEINSHIPGATYPIYEADFYWQYVKYGTMEPGDGTIIDLYEWRVKSDMDEFRDVTGRPQVVHKNGAKAYLGNAPTKEGTPNEKVGNVHLYYTNGLGLYEPIKYIQAGR